MSERENLKFCPHCDRDLPARTFRFHCEMFFDRIVLNVIDGDDEDQSLLMEIPLDEHENPPFNHLEEGLFDKTDFLDHEIWDEVGICNVEEDFPQATGCKSPPSVDVNIKSPCRSVSNVLARCLVVLLAYFWTCFHVSDNGMEFLIVGIKKCFEIGSSSSPVDGWSCCRISWYLVLFSKRNWFGQG